MVPFKITKSACGTEMYKTGSYNQFSGDKYYIYITVGTLEGSMDSPVKAVRFAGEQVYVEQSAQDKHEDGVSSYWDFKFCVANIVMGQTSASSFVGKFYFETEKGTIYTFDNDGQDFVYDKQAACKLLGEMQQALNF
jgi:hypothetical protein